MFHVTITITVGRLVPGQAVAFTSTGVDPDGGPGFTSDSWGIFEGLREDDGELYVMFSGGSINGTPQTAHGFPFAQLDVSGAIEAVAVANDWTLEQAAASWQGVPA